ncbi:MAG: aminoacyl-tRNA hydrolase [Omnitrophica bacterium RIFCSPLOWO2_01_FULL_45_10]|nr:MAG: aminoacyl-tRNA hydrolase [Omnitrophica bacterium RIFCSPLOWO2_01_FULL_45_10]
MKYIIGLGNPGIKYSATKHNIGHAVVKKLAKENRIKINKPLYSSLIGRGKISGQDVTLILPETFMNMSGKAASELFTKEIKSIEDILVICDDINLELGRIRLRKGGSSGGHKGLQSIIHMLRRDDFARIRVGIATNVHKGDITNYVLSPFKRKERKNVLHVISLAREAAELFIEKGLVMTMNRFNKKKIATS